MATNNAEKRTADVSSVSHTASGSAGVPLLQWNDDYSEGTEMVRNTPFKRFFYFTNPGVGKRVSSRLAWEGAEKYPELIYIVS